MEMRHQREWLLDFAQGSGLLEAQLWLVLLDVEVLVVIEEAAAWPENQL